MKTSMLTQSIYLLVMPLFTVLAVLACGTVVTQTAYYICPTAPVPTDEPPPTPYRIEPPQDFYRDDAVFVGPPGARMRLRFRLMNVSVQAAPPTWGGTARSLYRWSVEIRNLGTTDYETIPPAQMVISRIRTASGDVDGTWYTSDVAMRAAGITYENYAPLTPNTTRVYRLAAYTPVGSARRFTFSFDEDGSNTITWVNRANPSCSGDMADE